MRSDSIRVLSVSDIKGSSIEVHCTRVSNTFLPTLNSDFGVNGPRLLQSQLTIRLKARPDHSACVSRCHDSANAQSGPSAADSLARVRPAQSNRTCWGKGCM